MQTAMEHKPSQKSWLVTLRVHSIDFPQNMQTGSGMVCAGGGMASCKFLF